MIERDEFETPVLFRVDREHEHFGLASALTAVFPTEPHDINGRAMTCYAHIGQHGACELGWYHKTRPATRAEYADLKRELEECFGYRLKVYRRMTAQHREAFNAEVRRHQQRAA